MDKMIIKEASFSCNIGVSKKERKEKQEIVIDVELFLNIKKASQTDNIKYAVNYSKVYDLLKSIAEKNEFKLIETMAENFAKAISNKFSVEKVLVRVKKPGALANRNVKYAAVEIIRKKNNNLARW